MKVSLINDDALKVSIIKSSSKYRESPTVVVKPSVELVSGENRLGPWLVKVADEFINVSVNNMNVPLRFSYSNDQIIARGNLGLNDAVMAGNGVKIIN